MSYSHDWDGPYLVRVGAANGFYTARQQCGRCDTIRNPFTMLIIDRGDSRCWGAEGTELRSWTAELEGIRAQLEAIQAGGDEVHIDDSPGWPQHARTLRALG